MSTQSSYDMVDVEPALQLVLDRAGALPVSIEHVPFSFNLDGRTLGQDVITTTNHPPFRASIMDGYAVVNLAPGSYPISASITAGHGPTTALLPGEVSYITTGAPVPDGAVAVVKVEDTDPPTESQGNILNYVNVRTTSTVGKWIREIGSDIAAGSVVLRKGCRLGPAEIALLASVGPPSIPLVRQPVVGIMSTGDELVEAGSNSALANWKIKDSNRPMLLAAAKRAGAQIVDLGIAPDDEMQLSAALLSALKQVDILVTSGGVSMGSHDFVKKILGNMKGCVLHFGRVRMKPGKPTTFATVHNASTNALLFALPGNPVSSLVAFQLFVEPAVRRLLGYEDVECRHSRVQVRLERGLPLDPVRREYHRASLCWSDDAHGCSGGVSGSGGAFYATSTGQQRSSRLLSMVSASALLCLPRAVNGRRSLPAGTLVPALLLDRHVVPPPSVLLPHTCLLGELDGSTTSTSTSTSTTSVEEEKKDEEDGEEMEPTCPCCRAAGRSPQKKTSGKPPPPLSGGLFHNGGDPVKIGVLTVSDRAYNGHYIDRGGPEVLRNVNQMLTSLWSSECRVVPDEQRLIENAITDLCDRRGCHVVITTGGTGPSPRDVTPEATEAVCDRMFPGFGERMRAISLKHVPTAVLSRQTAGLRGAAFVLNLPGNPGAIEQILPYVMGSVGHCVQLAGGPRMIVSAPPVEETTATTTPSIDSGDTPPAQEYTIDAANLSWLENIVRSGSGGGGGGGGETKNSPTSMSTTINQIFQHVSQNVKDLHHVFTKKRGCGRAKSKKKVMLSLQLNLITFLQNAVQEWNLPNIDKGLRIVLDFVMEEDGVEQKIFGS